MFQYKNMYLLREFLLQTVIWAFLILFAILYLKFLLKCKLVIINKECGFELHKIVSLT